MIIVKEGDRHPVTLTVNHDLTGATLRLIIRHLQRTGLEQIVTPEVVDAASGVVSYTLDGTWERGMHYLELEIIQGEEQRTAPSSGQLEIKVVATLAA